MAIPEHSLANMRAEGKSIPAKQLAAGGPGSGPRPGTIRKFPGQTATSNKLLKLGFKEHSKGAANVRRFSRDNNPVGTYYPTGDHEADAKVPLHKFPMASKIHHVTVAPNGSFQHVSGVWTMKIGRGVEDITTAQTNEFMSNAEKADYAGELFEQFWAKHFGTSKRKKLAKTGAAMKDGSYPIQNGKDLDNAYKDYNRTGKSSAVKSHIQKRAKALGVSDPFGE